MDRRLLFPAVVATAWAQQTSPATAEAEKALRAKASQFFQFEVDKNFRKAEGLVATESKDYFYDHERPDIRGFSVNKVEFSADGQTAKVNVMLKKVLAAPGVGAQEFSFPYVSDWKLENGEWAWYYIPTDYIDTPFGKWQINRKDGGQVSLPPGMPAATANLDTLISIDRTSVQLTAGSSRTETVTISNQLPGTVEIEIGRERPQGLEVTIDKSQVARGEKGVISFRASDNAKPNGTVEIKAGPLQTFTIHVTTK